MFLLFFHMSITHRHLLSTMKQNKRGNAFPCECISLRCKCISKPSFLFPSFSWGAKINNPAVIACGAIPYFIHAISHNLGGNYAEYVVYHRSWRQSGKGRPDHGRQPQTRKKGKPSLPPPQSLRHGYINALISFTF